MTATEVVPAFVAATVDSTHCISLSKARVPGKKARKSALKELGVYRMAGCT